MAQTRNTIIAVFCYIKTQYDRNREATAKYRDTVTTSLIMVAKGPDAKAGSKLNLLNRNGKTVEMRTAARILKNIESPTIRPNVGLCQPITATAEISNPQTDARETATIDSLKK